VKITAAILSIWILLISFIPCVDAHNNFEDVKSNIELSQTIDHGCDTGIPDEACSPFCMCSCCQTIFYFDSPDFDLQCNHVTFSGPQNMPDQFISENFFSFWHPPKV
jgi:uncharacterized protein DUF6660